MKKVKLGEVVELVYGKALKKADRAPGPVPVVGSSGIIGTHERGITSGPTIVVGRKGSIGSVTWIDGPSWPIDTAYYVNFSHSQLDPRWVYWLLKQLGMENMNKSAAVPGLNRDDVYRLSALLPPLDEQRRIAAILDKADAIRQKRRQTIAHLDTLAQSTFHAYFENLDAPTSRLETSLTFLTSGSRGWAKYYTNDGDPFLRIQNVGNSRISLDDLARVQPPPTAEALRTRVEPGDVLLSITADLGRSAVVSDDLGNAYINQHLAILRAPELNSKYLSAFLSYGDGFRQMAKKHRGATKSGLNFDDIRSIVIPIPPRCLQDEFERLSFRFDQLQHSAFSSHARLETLFASLQSRAFRGEL